MVSSVTSKAVFLDEVNQRKGAEMQDNVNVLVQTTFLTYSGIMHPFTPIVFKSDQRPT